MLDVNSEKIVLIVSYFWEKAISGVRVLGLDLVSTPKINMLPTKGFKQATQLRIDEERKRTNT